MLDRKSVDTAEVDVREGDRSDVLEDRVVGDGATSGTSPIQYLVELPRVVSDHDIRQQRQGAGLGIEDDDKCASSAKAIPLRA